MAEENKSAENIPEKPENAAAKSGGADESERAGAEAPAKLPEEGETAESPADSGDRKKKKFRIALIVVLSLLIAVAVGLLTWYLVDRAEDSVYKEGAGTEKILYCAVEQGNIWENKDYIAAQKSLEVSGQMTIRYFDSEQTAEELFAALGELPYGGETLGKYFTYLIEGVRDKNAAAGFAALFAPSFNRRVPSDFFPQKICNIYLRMLEYGEEGNAEWEVSFRILNNDGWAVNYFTSRDSGKARFTLTANDGVWTISKIATVYSGSTYSQ